LGTADGLQDKQRRYADNIQRSGKQLLDMINDILDLAKIESGKMELHLEDFALGDLVDRLVSMARPLAEKKNLDLEYDVAPDVPVLHQDAGKTQQVLYNLVSNAIKFTPEGGRIRIAARRSAPDRIEIAVADTGVGISDEDQRHIFEKFRQGGAGRPENDPLTREHPGTGLGLSIVKELARLLGGEVRLKSELGIGSTFTIELPVHLSEKPPLEVTSHDEPIDLTKARRVAVGMAAAAKEGLD
jgi:signal transduction histidine kinase